MKPEDVELDQQDRACRRAHRCQPVKQAVAVEQAGQAIDARRMGHVADQANEMCYLPASSRSGTRRKALRNIVPSRR